MQPHSPRRKWLCAQAAQQQRGAYADAVHVPARTFIIHGQIPGAATLLLDTMQDEVIKGKRNLRPGDQISNDAYLPGCEMLIFEVHH